MEKKQKRGGQDLTSLIPTIKSTEKLLDELLQGERDAAAGRIRAAESEAAQRVKQAAEELPRLIECERTARAGALHERAARELADARTAVEVLEREGRVVMARAVRFIVSKVWPGALP
jgi:hypothetical protein